MELFYTENTDTPAGHICTCGKIHKWPLYVYAHWNDILSYKCPSCMREIEIVGGHIKEL